MEPEPYISRGAAAFSRVGFIIAYGNQVEILIVGEQGELLYDLKTDENGETQKVPLETLDRGFSQNQYYSGLPYKSYDVLAERY